MLTQKDLKHLSRYGYAQRESGLINQSIYIKTLQKEVFINRPKRPEVVKDQKAFLKILLNLELYLVEFN